MSRIQGLVDQLYIPDHSETKEIEHTWFWMDTLCVPVDPAHKTYGISMIRKMGEIYKSANHVLVLDSSIQAIPRSAHVFDKIVALFLSNWNRRLWTLQEGLFAKSLYFQFGGNMLQIKDLHP